jgi:hypothetical protein
MPFGFIEQGGSTVTFTICVREAPDSNIGRSTDYSHGLLVATLFPSKGANRILIHDDFLPYYLLSIPNLYTVEYDNTRAV